VSLLLENCSTFRLTRWCWNWLSFEKILSVSSSRSAGWCNPSSLCIHLKSTFQDFGCAWGSRRFSTNFPFPKGLMLLPTALQLSLALTCLAACHMLIGAQDPVLTHFFRAFVDSVDHLRSLDCDQASQLLAAGSGSALLRIFYAPFYKLGVGWKRNPF
jgi:hypothetical protein